MKKEFVPYEIAVNLKELGFDKPCFTYYGLNNVENKLFFDIDPDDGELTELNQNQFYQNNLSEVGRISAPTWKQTFKFFRDKYFLNSFIVDSKSYDWYFNINDMQTDDVISEVLYFKKYEEAELESIRQLIKIAKEKLVESK
jgi:hypothetical protein